MNSKEEKTEERYYNLLLEELKLKMLYEGIKYWRDKRLSLSIPKLNGFLEEIPLKKAIERIDELFDNELLNTENYKIHLEELVSKIEDVTNDSIFR